MTHILPAIVAMAIGILLETSCGTEVGNGRIPTSHKGETEPKEAAKDETSSSQDVPASKSDIPSSDKANESPKDAGTSGTIQPDNDVENSSGEPPADIPAQSQLLPPYLPYLAAPCSSPLSEGNGLFVDSKRAESFTIDLTASGKSQVILANKTLVFQVLDATSPPFDIAWIDADISSQMVCHNIAFDASSRTIVFEDQAVVTWQVEKAQVIKIKVVLKQGEVYEFYKSQGL